MSITSQVSRLDTQKTLPPTKQLNLAYKYIVGFKDKGFMS